MAALLHMQSAVCQQLVWQVHAVPVCCQVQVEDLCASERIPGRSTHACPHVSPATMVAWLAVTAGHLPRQHGTGRSDRWGPRWSRRGRGLRAA